MSKHRKSLHRRGDIKAESLNKGIPGVEKQAGSKQETEHFKAVCCHPAYLTYM